MIRGAIFDMDGVLVDNSEVHCKAFAMLAERYGTKVTPDDLKYYFGRGNDDIMRGVLPADIVERYGVVALAEEKEALYREIYSPTIIPVAGLKTLLEELQRAGIPCAVGSSGPTVNVDFVLCKCGIADFFAARVDSSRVRNCKPDPEIFLTAASDLGVAPAECVVFEDSVAGITAARRAGMKVVGIATSLTKNEIEAKVGPDLIVDDFTPLTVALLQSL